MLPFQSRNQPVAVVPPDLAEAGAGHSTTTRKSRWRFMGELPARAAGRVGGQGVPPIWLGVNSLVAKRVVERLYACSGILNDQGQYAYYGRVGGCLITGDEDGAKHCAMSLLYSLQHIG